MWAFATFTSRQLFQGRVEIMYALWCFERSVAVFQLLHKVVSMSDPEKMEKKNNPLLLEQHWVTFHTELSVPVLDNYWLYLGDWFWVLEHSCPWRALTTLWVKEKEKSLFSTDNCFYMAKSDRLTRERLFYSWMRPSSVSCKVSLSKSPFLFIPFLPTFMMLRSAFLKAWLCLLKSRKLNCLTSVIKVAKMKPSILTRG